MGKPKRFQELNARAKRVDAVLVYGGWAAGGVMVVALLVAAYVNLASSQVVRSLAEAPVEELQEVFFGGAPWLVLCADSRNAVDKEGQLRQTFTEAAKLLDGGKVAKTAVLDCTRELPSGKSVYERLALNATRAPVLFLAQGGDRPVQLEPKLLRKPKKKAKASRRKPKRRKRKGKANEGGDEEVQETHEPPAAPSDADLGRPLAKEVKQRFLKRYKVQEIKTGKALKTGCIERKACALFVGRGPPSRAIKELASRARRATPLVRWAYLDSAAYQLNVEPLLTEGVQVRRERTWLVLFRSGKFVTMANDGLGAWEKDLRHFVSEYAGPNASEDFGFRPLTKIADIKRRAKKPAKASKPSSAEGSKTQKNSARPQDEPRKKGMTPEEAREEQRRRELRRREEMEREAQEFEPTTEGWEAEGDDDDDDDDDEEEDDDDDDDEEETEEEDELVLD